MARRAIIDVDLSSLPPIPERKKRAVVVKEPRPPVDLSKRIPVRRKRKKGLPTGAGETPIKRQAYDYWYGLGDARSYTLVADKFGVAEITVKLWSRQFKWRERLQKRMQRLEEKAGQAEVIDLAATKVMYKKYFDRLLKEFFDDVSRRAADGQSVAIIRNVDDLERVISIALKLSGGELSTPVPGEGTGGEISRFSLMVEKISNNPGAGQKLQELYREMYGQKTLPSVKELEAVESFDIDR